MKTICLFFITLICLKSSAQLQPAICEVVAVYEKVKANNLKIIDIYGVKKVDYYLSEINLTEGSYEVDLTRIDYNYYEVNLKNTVIETRNCYEFPSYKKMFLNIEQGYTNIGYLIFPK